MARNSSAVFCIPGILTGQHILIACSAEMTLRALWWQEFQTFNPHNQAAVTYHLAALVAKLGIAAQHSSAAASAHTRRWFRRALGIQLFPL